MQVFPLLCLQVISRLSRHAVLSRQPILLLHSPKSIYYNNTANPSLKLIAVDILPVLKNLGYNAGNVFLCNSALEVVQKLVERVRLDNYKNTIH